MNREIESVDLAVDVVLQIIIGSADSRIDSLLSRAEHGEVEIHINDATLFFAIYSVKSTDKVNFSGLAKLLRFACIRNRRSASDPGHVIPGSEDVARWRKIALSKGPMTTISF